MEMEWNGDCQDGGDGWRFALHNREQRHACGSVAKQHWLQGRLKRSGMGRALRDLQSHRRKGGSHDSFIEYAELAIQHGPALRAVYGCMAARQWALRTHILQNRQMHRICQCLALGASKVKGWRWHKRHRGATTRSPARARPGVAVVCLGDASAGWGSSISRHISAPVQGLRDFFRREYCDSNGVARGLRICRGSMARVHMHLVTVSEYRSSQTCSRCFDPRGLKPFRKGKRSVFKLKACPHGGQAIAPDRLTIQQHDSGQHLILDRDRNAARNLAVVGMAHLMPATMLHQPQLLQLLRCMHRQARSAWLEQTEGQGGQGHPTREARGQWCRGREKGVRGGVPKRGKGQRGRGCEIGVRGGVAKGGRGRRGGGRGGRGGG